jgi:hypothetical protein
MTVGREKESDSHSCRDIGSFLVLLADMEDAKECTKTISGFVEGPFSTRAVFSCTVRMGLE